jgi:hypothetical protein
VVALRYVSACVGSLGLGCDMKRPELVALFGGGAAAMTRAITSSDRSWAGPGPGQ